MDEAAQAPVELPLRPQDEVECRRCEVHCDKVVYPGACIERSCPFVYAYEAWGHTYVGCMQRVYGGRDRPRPAAGGRGEARGLRRHPRHRGAAADVQGRGVALLREPRRRARLPESGVPRAPARAPELPRDRADQPERVSRDRVERACVCSDTSLLFVLRDEVVTNGPAAAWARSEDALLDRPRRILGSTRSSSRLHRDEHVGRRDLATVGRSRLRSWESRRPSYHTIRELVRAERAAPAARTAYPAGGLAPFSARPARPA